MQRGSFGRDTVTATAAIPDVHDRREERLAALVGSGHLQDPNAARRENRGVRGHDGCALVTVLNRRAWRVPHYHLHGINWLPRSWADRIVERIGRSKRGARFTDHQRLGDMYY